MCGIAGILGAGGGVEPMIRALSHRGPNGVRVEGNLAHARLSIIDLEGGWQPLHAAGATVVGNGEIYNYLELARDFGLEGQLATGSDFEPLLHLYAREGETAFERLRGMYAFCLVDADGRAWLARDPFGIKPLYVLQLEAGVAFASEPRAFVAAGLLTPEPDDRSAEDLLGLNYVLGDRSLLKGVRRLRPGEVLEVRGGTDHRALPPPCYPP
jgi:asparagine synthase (glutamine-hydrolysing)